MLSFLCNVMFLTSQLTQWFFQQYNKIINIVFAFFILISKIFIYTYTPFGRRQSHEFRKNSSRIFRPRCRNVYGKNSQIFFPFNFTPELPKYFLWQNFFYTKLIDIWRNEQQIGKLSPPKLYKNCGMRSLLLYLATKSFAHCHQIK